MRKKLNLSFDEFMTIKFALLDSFEYHKLKLCSSCSPEIDSYHLDTINSLNEVYNKYFE